MIDHLSALRRENAAFHAAVDVSRLSERVASCPDWTLADLVWHMGEVHWFWGSIAEGRLTNPQDSEATKPPRPQDGEELVEWARASGERIQRILSETDPSTEVWTWAPQKDVGFIRRRMAHETAVHRWDAEATTGQGRPIDAELAVDGIDEMIRLFMPYGAQDGPLPGSVHLHCTDAEGEWTLSADWTCTVGHSKGDVALRGTASDLMLVLWRRKGLDDVEVIGDRSVAEGLYDRLTID